CNVRLSRVELGEQPGRLGVGREQLHHRGRINVRTGSCLPAVFKETGAVGIGEEAGHREASLRVRSTTLPDNGMALRFRVNPIPSSCGQATPISVHFESLPSLSTTKAKCEGRGLAVSVFMLMSS